MPKLQANHRRVCECFCRVVNMQTLTNTVVFHTLPYLFLSSWPVLPSLAGGLSNGFSMNKS